MINLFLNNKKMVVSDNLTLKEFLTVYNYDQLSIAVAVNQIIIHQVDYGKIQLTDGDQIDLVSPMQGG